MRMPVLGLRGEPTDTGSRFERPGQESRTLIAVNRYRNTKSKTRQNPAIPAASRITTTLDHVISSWVDQFTFFISVSVATRKSTERGLM